MQFADLKINFLCYDATPVTQSAGWEADTERLTFNRRDNNKQQHCVEKQKVVHELMNLVNVLT